MKIRNSGGGTPVTGVTSLRKTGKSGEAKKVRRPEGVTDTASVMGIPEVELTPKVRQALAQLMSEVHSLRDELEQVRKRATYLEQLADQDPLAPVLNRRAFVRELSRNTAFAERYGSAGSVVYFDINGMKAINDRFGHAAGDMSLKHVAEVLLANVRASDVVGRLGGDEFGVILAQSDGPDALEKAAGLANHISSMALEWDGETLHVRVAYGVHTLSKGDKVDEALNKADQAMYAQKKAAAEERAAAEKPPAKQSKG